MYEDLMTFLRLYFQIRPNRAAAAIESVIYPLLSNPAV